jgi:hypothetical protein
MSSPEDDNLYALFYETVVLSYVAYKTTRYEGKAGSRAIRRGDAIYVCHVFFYWILQNGGEFAAKIMQSTQQIGNDATGANGLDWGAFVQAGSIFYWE